MFILHLQLLLSFYFWRQGEHKWTLVRETNGLIVRADKEVSITDREIRADREVSARVV